MVYSLTESKPAISAPVLDNSAVRIGNLSLSCSLIARYIQVKSCSLEEHHILAVGFKGRLLVMQATLIIYKEQYRNISGSVQRALMFLHFI